MLICYGFCGSFCTVGRSIEAMKILITRGFDVQPVGSFNFLSTDTRFGLAKDLRERIEGICHRRFITTLAEAEPVGPVINPDAMIIAPLTGSSLSKLAHGISDTPVTLAAKAHLRNNRPLLLCLATNDALSGNFENLAKLYQKKNVYFLPLSQDDPIKKPTSLVSLFERIPEALDAALAGRQLLPLFI